MKYKMHYIGGGGNEYDGGEWEVKETDKIIIFTCTKEPFILYCDTVLKTRKDNNCKHHLKVLEDSYLVYPNRSGTPHIFEKYE